MQKLEKILEEIDAHAIEFETFGISDDYISVGWVKEIIRKHMNDGWISVEEKPNKTGYYLVQLSRKLPNEDYSDRVVVLYNGEEKEFMTYSNLIIAWQPLPEQYRPEKGAKIC